MSNMTIQTNRLYDRCTIILTRGYNARMSELRAMKQTLLSLDPEMEAIRAAGIYFDCEPASAFISEAKVKLDITVATLADISRLCAAFKKRGFDDAPQVAWHDDMRVLERENVRLHITYKPARASACACGSTCKE